MCCSISKLCIALFLTVIVAFGMLKMLILMSFYFSGVCYLVFNFKNCVDLYENLAEDLEEKSVINIQKVCREKMWKCNFNKLPFAPIAKCRE